MTPMASIHAPAEGRLHVSYSQVHTYLTCPEKFRQQYALGRTPSHRPGEMVFGSAVHGALALYHARLRDDGEKPPLGDVLAEFDALWAAAGRSPVPVLWADEESPEKLAAKGHDLLRLYHEQIAVCRVLGVERHFALPAPSRHWRSQPRIVSEATRVRREPGMA